MPSKAASEVTIRKRPLFPEITQTPRRKSNGFRVEDRHQLYKLESYSSDLEAASASGDDCKMDEFEAGLKGADKEEVLVSEPLEEEPLKCQHGEVA